VQASHSDVTVTAALLWSASGRGLACGFVYRPELNSVLDAITKRRQAANVNALLRINICLRLLRLLLARRVAPTLTVPAYVCAARDSCADQSFRCA